LQEWGEIRELLISQRPQKVNKHAVALRDYYCIFRMVHNLDIDAIGSILGQSQKDFLPIAHKIKGQHVGDYMITDGLNVEYYRRERKGEDTLAPPKIVEEKKEKETRQKTLKEDTPIAPIKKTRAPRSKKGVVREAMQLKLLGRSAEYISKKTGMAKERVWRLGSETAIKKYLAKKVKGGKS